MLADGFARERRESREDELLVPFCQGRGANPSRNHGVAPPGQQTPESLTDVDYEFWHKEEPCTSPELRANSPARNLPMSSSASAAAWSIAKFEGKT